MDANQFSCHERSFDGKIELPLEILQLILACANSRETFNCKYLFFFLQLRIGWLARNQVVSRRSSEKARALYGMCSHSECDHANSWVKSISITNQFIPILLIEFFCNFHSMIPYIRSGKLVQWFPIGFETFWSIRCKRRRREVISVMHARTGQAAVPSSRRPITCSERSIVGANLSMSFS